MKKIIVTTTINPPTEAIRKFCGKKDWNLLIVGDRKTPHDLYRALEEEYPQVMYLHPELQEKKYRELSDSIGWDSIQRRNLGFVEAYAMGTEVMATVDDDNIPYEHWGENVAVGSEIVLDCYASNNGYFDPLSVTNASHVWHRGYPVEHVATKNAVRRIGAVKRTVLVQADLWDGDPDVDAIARIAFRPDVTLDVRAPFCTSDPAPFNSQNTFVHRSVIPFYMMLPHVGRMDDIWAAYILQKRFPGSVIYCPASVRQDRNVHNLVKDLEGEMIGYAHTLAFIEGTYALPERTQRAYGVYVRCFSS
jgi:hypothetical protein